MDYPGAGVFMKHCYCISELALGLQAVEDAFDLEQVICDLNERGFSAPSIVFNPRTY